MTGCGGKDVEPRHEGLVVLAEALHDARVGLRDDADGAEEDRQHEDRDDDEEEHEQDLAE
jgi:hypothetical protein